eukprot:jgi/Bigna1/76564/fgenesh1_pg.42_\
MASICTAYLLWMTFGMFGLHHLYMVWEHQYESLSFAKYLEPKDEEKPRGTWAQAFGSFFFAIYLRLLISGAIPEEYLDPELKTFILIVPCALGTAIGIYLVGNNGRSGGAFTMTFLAAILGEVINMIADSGWGWVYYIVMPINVFSYTRQWKIENEQPRSISSYARGGVTRTTVVHFLKGALILALFLSFVWFNATITISHDDLGREETIKVRDHLKNIYRSPAVQDFIQVMAQLHTHIQHNGWRTLWDEFIKAMDVKGESNAFKVLGLAEGSSMNAVKKAYRSAVLKYHPDKCKLPKEECARNFEEVQEAYETLKSLDSERKNSRAGSDRTEGSGTRSGRTRPSARRKRKQSNPNRKTADEL